VAKWEMPKETINKPDEGGLVRLKYTFRYGDKFVEPLADPNVKEDDEIRKMAEAIMDKVVDQLLNKAAEVVLRED
jgi:hypothetical protein